MKKVVALLLALTILFPGETLLAIGTESVQPIRREAALWDTQALSARPLALSGSPIQETVWLFRHAALALVLGTTLLVAQTPSFTPWAQTTQRVEQQSAQFQTLLQERWRLWANQAPLQTLTSADQTILEGVWKWAAVQSISDADPTLHDAKVALDTARSTAQADAAAALQSMQRLSPKNRQYPAIEKQYGETFAQFQRAINTATQATTQRLASAWAIEPIENSPSQLKARIYAFQFFPSRTGTDVTRTVFEWTLVWNRPEASHLRRGQRTLLHQASTLGLAKRWLVQTKPVLKQDPARPILPLLNHWILPLLMMSLFIKPARRTSKDYVFYETEQAPSAVTDLWRATWWGQYGKSAVYRILSGSNLPSVVKRVFHHLYDVQTGELLAGRALRLHRLGWKGSGYVNAIYTGWTAVSEPHQGEGWGSALARESWDHFPKHFTNNAPVLGYAYIDAHNERSIVNLENNGYVRLGSFWFTLITSLWPKQYDEYQVGSEGVKNAFKEKLDRAYLGHALYDVTTLDDVNVEHLFYWRDKTTREILAMITAKEEVWEFKSLGFLTPSIEAKLLIWFERIPVLKRILPVREFHFLKVGNIVYEPGHEKTVKKLIDSILAVKKLNRAIVYMDKRSDVYRGLKRNGVFSWLNPLFETQVQVMGRVHGTDEQARTLIDDIRSRPLWISFFHNNLLWMTLLLASYASTAWTQEPLSPITPHPTRAAA